MKKKIEGKESDIISYIHLEGRKNPVYKRKEGAPHRIIGKGMFKWHDELKAENKRLKEENEVLKKEIEAIKNV